MKTTNTERESNVEGKISQPCLNSDINSLKEDYIMAQSKDRWNKDYLKDK